jgi:phage-related protein
MQIIRLLIRTSIGAIDNKSTSTLEVRFFKTDTGAEPVRNWLRELSATDRKALGEDIKTLQFGWPLGMPLVRKMDKDLWEVRVHLDGRIARVLFTVSSGKIVLLHGFIKKSQATPQSELKLAKDRMRSK